jgi:hypothetical protein
MHPLNITAVTGIAVDLRCKVRLRDCGTFHRIEWYRGVKHGGLGNERIYVYQHIPQNSAGVAKSEGAWRGRAKHHYDAKRHVMRVSLYPTKLEDAGFYRN